MKGSVTAAEIMWNERGLVQLAPREVEILRLRATGASLAARLLEPPSDEP
jgi:DNA-binding CsgD family transcriptional regulator